MKLTDDVGEVSSRVKHALLAAFPRRRYVTGRESTTYTMISHLPTLVIDWIITSKVKLIGPRQNFQKKDN